jgi:hypothetical protein
LPTNIDTSLLSQPLRCRERPCVTRGASDPTQSEVRSIVLPDFDNVAYSATSVGLETRCGFRYTTLRLVPGIVTTIS